MKEDFKHILTITDCPDMDAFYDYLEGTMKSSNRRSFEMHLADCEMCTDALDGFEQFPRNESKIAVGWIDQKIDEKIEPAGKKRPKYIWFAAASLLVSLGLGLYLLGNSAKKDSMALEYKSEDKEESLSNEQKEVITPSNEALKTVSSKDAENRTASKSSIDPVVREELASEFKQELDEVAPQVHLPIVMVEDVEEIAYEEEDFASDAMPMESSMEDFDDDMAENEISSVQNPQMNQITNVESTVNDPKRTATSSGGIRLNIEMEEDSKNLESVEVAVHKEALIRANNKIAAERADQNKDLARESLDLTKADQVSGDVITDGTALYDVNETSPSTDLYKKEEADNTVKLDEKNNYAYTSPAENQVNISENFATQDIKYQASSPTETLSISPKSNSTTNTIASGSLLESTDKVSNGVTLKSKESDVQMLNLSEAMLYQKELSNGGVQSLSEIAVNTKKRSGIKNGRTKASKAKAEQINSAAYRTGNFEEGLNFYKKEQYKNALTYFKTAKNIDHKPGADIYIGLTQIQLGKYQDALNTLAKTSENGKDSYYYDALWLKVYIQRKLGQDYAAPLKVLRSNSNIYQSQAKKLK